MDWNEMLSPGSDFRYLLALGVAFVIGVIMVKFAAHGGGRK